MRKSIRKKGMAVVMTAALMAGNVGNGECYIKNSVAEAADIEYVSLNEEFDGNNTVYFQLPKSGIVLFENSGESEYKNVYKVLDNGNEELYTSKACKLRLAKGNYKVTDESGCYIEINKIYYQEETETIYEGEWNDTLDTAKEINANVGYIGNLNLNAENGDWRDEKTNDRDYYKVVLKQSGKVQIQYFIEDLSYYDDYYGTCQENIHDIIIYSEDEEGAVEEIFSVPTSETDKTRYSQYYRLSKGTYYILIQGGLDSNGDPYYCNDTDYQLKVNYEPEESSDHEQEYNDSKDTANTIATNIGYTGNIPTDEDKDYYKFTLEKPSRVKLKMQVPRQSTDGLFSAILYKEDSTSKITNVKTTVNPIAYSTEQLLEAGTYYVAVEAGTTAEDAVDYTLTVNATEVVIVENISITPEKTPVYVGETFSMVAEITPEDAENKEITWTSSDPTVATIDENGKVTCVGAGNVYITATAADGSGVKAEYLLTVSKILVSGIVISAPSNQAVVGDKIALTAEIKPSNALNKAIVWDSSNESVATVSQDGKVSCVGKGTVVISATAEDEGRISGSITLQVAEKVTVTEAPEKTEAPDDAEKPVVPDATEEPEKTAEPDATEEPEKTAEPDATEEPEKTAEPDATEEPEKTAIPDDTEMPEKTEVSNDSEVPKTTKAPEETTTVATATPTPRATGETTIVTTATPTPRATGETTIVTTATPTPRATGETTIVATATPTPRAPEETTTVATATPAPSDGQQQTAPEQTPNPFAGDLVQSIQLYTELEEEELASIRVGDKFQIYADVLPEALEESEEVELSWSTSDKKVAKVSKNGMVTCVGEGMVTITATATDGSKVSSSLTFTILKAQSKNNYLSKLIISQGKLTPVFKKSKTKYTLTLSKNMSSVIIRPTKMDSTAKVKIKGTEQSKITVRLKSGKSKTVVIKVTAENGKVKTYRIRVKRK